MQDKTVPFVALLSIAGCTTNNYTVYEYAPDAEGTGDATAGDGNAAGHVTSAQDASAVSDAATMDARSSTAPGEDGSADAAIDGSAAPEAGADAGSTVPPSCGGTCGPDGTNDGVQLVTCMAEGTSEPGCYDCGYEIGAGLLGQLVSVQASCTGGAAILAVCTTTMGQAQATLGCTGNEVCVQSAGQPPTCVPAATSTCTCGDASSCYYNDPADAVVVTLIDAQDGPATVMTGAPTPDAITWFDIDVSAFPQGGLIQFIPVSSTSCVSSAWLVDECTPMSSGPPSSVLASDIDVPAGTTGVVIGYAFSATDVLHLALQGCTAMSIALRANP